ncbi:MAG: hypothetical protein Crog4KO_08470 [Crocinitomicaceae bacterium]
MVRGDVMIVDYRQIDTRQLESSPNIFLYTKAQGIIDKGPKTTYKCRLKVS